MEKVESRKAP